MILYRIVVHYRVTYGRSRMGKISWAGCTVYCVCVYARTCMLVAQVMVGYCGTGATPTCSDGGLQNHGMMIRCCTYYWWKRPHRGVHLLLMKTPSSVPVDSTHTSIHAVCFISNTTLKWLLTSVILFYWYKTWFVLNFAWTMITLIRKNSMWVQVEPNKALTCVYSTKCAVASTEFSWQWAVSEHYNLSTDSLCSTRNPPLDLRDSQADVRCPSHNSARLIRAFMYECGEKSRTNVRSSRLRAVVHWDTLRAAGPGVQS